MIVIFICDISCDLISDLFFNLHRGFFVEFGPGCDLLSGLFFNLLPPYLFLNLTHLKVKL